MSTTQINPDFDFQALPLPHTWDRDKYNRHGEKIGTVKHALVLAVEIVNLYEATGEERFKQYPISVGAALMIASPGPETMKKVEEGTENPSLADVYQYMGGVPVEDILSSDIGEENWTKEFTIKEATLVEDYPQHGTFAARGNRGLRFAYPMFRTREAAAKWATMLYNEALTGRMTDIYRNVLGNKTGVLSITCQYINMAMVTGDNLLFNMSK